MIAQQPDVLQAIQIFRRKAQDAGNLKTDDKQVVVDQPDAVKIVPAKQEVVYVPQYQPSAAVVQQAGAGRHLFVDGLSELLCSWRGGRGGDDWLCGWRRDSLRAELGQRCGL